VQFVIDLSTILRYTVRSISAIEYFETIEKTMKSAMRIVLLAWFVICLFVSTAWAEKAEVMIINSYNADHFWVKGHNQALAKALANRATLRYRYLDSKNLPSEEYEKRADAIWEECKRLHPKVVVLTDDNAVRLLGKRIMSANIPVVFLGVNLNPREYLGKMSLATGVLEHPLFKRSLSYLEGIPELHCRHCRVLFDSSVTAHAMLKHVFHDKPSQTIGETTTDIEMVQTFAQWKKLVLEAKDNGDDLLFVGLYHALVDENGTRKPDQKVLRWTAAHSPVPVFGLWKFDVGRGKAIGGLVHTGEEQGFLAAEMVLKILNGTSPADIYPKTVKYGELVFSRSELARWHLTIPPEFTNTRQVVYVE